MVFCFNSFCIIADNLENNKKFDIDQVRTISADFGWQKNVQQLGYEEAVQFRFRSDGTIWRHYWDHDSSLNKKRGATDRYDSGTYVITDSSSSRIKITITWSNGKQQSCYIVYNRSASAEFHFDMMTYEELHR